MRGEFDESWPDLASRFEEYTEAPAALHCAALLRQAMPRWAGHVLVSSWWVHGLRFAAVSADQPSKEQVRVVWSDDTFEFSLLRAGATVQPIGAEQAVGKRSSMRSWCRSSVVRSLPGSAELPLGAERSALTVDVVS